MSKSAAKSDTHARASDISVATPTPSDVRPDVVRGKLVRSEGQRMLLGVHGTLSEIGAAVGVSKQTVCDWRDGSHTPADQHRITLERKYGIPLESWAPTSTAPAKPAQAEDRDADEAEPTALEDYNRLLRALRAQLDRPGLLARERVQVADAFSRALAHKERLERGRELVEARVIKSHPKWRELKAAIITALLDFPEAARAVEAAVTRVLGAEPDADT